MNVQNVGLVLLQPTFQPADSGQGNQAFLADGPIQVFCTGSEHALLQRTVSSDDRDFMPQLNVTFCQFRGHQLRSTQIQRNQSLNNVHGLWGIDPVEWRLVGQDVFRTAIRTGGLTGFLNRQINPWM